MVLENTVIISGLFIILLTFSNIYFLLQNRYLKIKYLKVKEMLREPVTGVLQGSGKQIQVSKGTTKVLVTGEEEDVNYDFSYMVFEKREELNNEETPR